MSPPRDRDERAPQRRFLLAPAGATPRLLPADEDHARRVLRLAPGDLLEGLDRAGAAHPYRVRALSRSGLELEPAGEPRREPEPGAPGAPLPWFELWLSPPRPPRAEALVERLCQLGAARLRPLVLERTPPHGRGGRSERLTRIADETLKQCGRLWPLELAEPLPLERALADPPPAALILLDPRAPRTLGEVLELLDPPHVRASWTRATPLALIAGPEGGLSPAESSTLERHGAHPARLSPHVLRIETAAEAAAAIVAQRALERAPH